MFPPRHACPLAGKTNKQKETIQFIYLKIKKIFLIFICKGLLQHYNKFNEVFFFFFDVDHFLNLYWICYYGASVLWFRLFGVWISALPARDQTSIPYTGRWNLAHWAAREVPKQSNIGQRIWNGKEEVRGLKSQQWEAIQSYRLNTASEGKQALSALLASRQTGTALEPFSASDVTLRYSFPFIRPVSSQNPCFAHVHKPTWTRKVIQNCQWNRRA